MNKQFVFGIFCLIILVSFMSFMNTIHAEYQYDDSSTVLTPTSSIDAPASQSSVQSAVTTPGIPNTGAGGSATNNILEIGVSSLFVIGGLRLVYKSILYKNARRRA